MTQASAHELFKIDDYIMQHVLNSNEWHVPFLPPIHLPPILSLHAVMVILCAALLVFLFCFIYKKNERVPTGMTNALEAFVQFIRDEIAIPSLGKDDGMKLTPLLCTFFFFILSLNLIGLIPMFATATANINVTGALAFITFFLITVGAMYKNGIAGFFKALIPSGVPAPILILIFPLELVGIFIKSFALMIRLFANMLAGHMVILSLLGLVVMLGAYALPAVVLAVAVSALEVFVAFLQAYIFTLLSAVFIGQMHHPEH